MEVYLAIDYPLTSKVPQKYPVPKLHYGTGIEFEYTWIVECQPLVKLTDAEKFSREVVKKIEKIRGKLEMTLDVYCYPNEPPNHVKVTLKDVDGVLEKMDEVAGFTGDIKIQYLEKIMQFDVLSLDYGGRRYGEPSLWGASGVKPYSTKRCMELVGEKIQHDTFAGTICLKF